jgi:hypothetical protein
MRVKVSHHINIQTVVKALTRHAFAALFAAAIALVVTSRAEAQNITNAEVKLGILQHDPTWAGGREKGVNINPELILDSPVNASWVASLPDWAQFAFQPRPAAGVEINTADGTNEAYLGASWAWQLVGNVFKPDDGLEFAFFFGASLNDGKITSHIPDRKSLGSNLLFRENFELGYRISPEYLVSLNFDHLSNAGFGVHNQSINDVGIRFGVGF